MHQVESNLLWSEDSHERFLGEAGKINVCAKTINTTVKNSFQLNYRSVGSFSTHYYTKIFFFL